MDIVLPILLLLFGCVVGQNSRWRPYEAPTNGYYDRGRADDARNLYFMDGLAQRVRASPQNAKNILPVYQARILLQLQLISYTDPGRALPNNRVCYWNPTNNNNQKPAGKNITGVISAPAAQNCRFMFSTLVTAPQYNPTYFILMSIDILVHHYGNVADKNRQLINYGQLVHVDSFSRSLITDIPAAQGANYNSRQIQLTGISDSDQSLNTKLTLSYGLRCNTNLLGENCDLQCSLVNSFSNSSGNFSTLACNSTMDPTKSYLCLRKNTKQGQGQAVNTGGQVLAPCTVCPFGISGGQCSPGKYFAQSTSGKVAFGYYVATIVLAILLAIILIFLIGAIILLCWGGKNEDDDRRHREWSFRNRNQPEFVKPSPPIGNGYKPVNTEPNPEWQPRTAAAAQRSSLSDSRNSSSRPTQQLPYYDQPSDKAIPPLGIVHKSPTGEHSGSRASRASSSEENYRQQNGPRREAAV